LSTLQITETYALPNATQRSITHELVKQLRADYPEGHMYHYEAKVIVDAIVASDTALKSLDVFTEDMLATAVERGILDQ